MVTNLSVIVHVMYTVYVHAIKLHSSPHPCIQQVSPKAKGESKLCILTVIQVDHVLAGIFYLRLLALENEIAGITQANFATIGYKPCCSMHRKKFRVAWYWNLRFFSPSTYRSTTHGVSWEQCSFLKNVPGTFFNATHQVKAIAIGVVEANPQV